MEKHIQYYFGIPMESIEYKRRCWIKHVLFSSLQIGKWSNLTKKPPTRIGVNVPKTWLSKSANWASKPWVPVIYAIVKHRMSSNWLWAPFLQFHDVFFEMIVLLFGHLDLLRSNADPKGTPRQKKWKPRFFTRVFPGFPVTFHGGKTYVWKKHDLKNFGKNWCVNEAVAWRFQNADIYKTTNVKSRVDINGQWLVSFYESNTQWNTRTQFF